MTKQPQEAFDVLHKYYNIRNNTNYNILNTIWLNKDRRMKEYLIKRVYNGSLRCFHGTYILHSFMGIHLFVYSIFGIGTPLRLDELLHMAVYSPEYNTCRKYK